MGRFLRWLEGPGYRKIWVAVWLAVAVLLFGPKWPTKLHADIATFCAVNVSDYEVDFLDTGDLVIEYSNGCVYRFFPGGGGGFSTSGPCSTLSAAEAVARWWWDYGGGEYFTFALDEICAESCIQSLVDECCHPQDANLACRLCHEPCGPFGYDEMLCECSEDCPEGQLYNAACDHCYDPCGPSGVYSETECECVPDCPPGETWSEPCSMCHASCGAGESWSDSECECVEDSECPPGEVWSAACMECHEPCGTGAEWSDTECVCEALCGPGQTWSEECETCHLCGEGFAFNDMTCECEPVGPCDGFGGDADGDGICYDEDCDDFDFENDSLPCENDCEPGQRFSEECDECYDVCPAGQRWSDDDCGCLEIGECEFCEITECEDEDDNGVCDGTGGCWIDGGEFWPDVGGNICGIEPGFFTTAACNCEAFEDGLCPPGPCGWDGDCETSDALFTWPGDLYYCPPIYVCEFEGGENEDDDECCDAEDIDDANPDICNCADGPLGGDEDNDGCCKKFDCDDDDPDRGCPNLDGEYDRERECCGCGHKLDEHLEAIQDKVHALWPEFWDDAAGAGIFEADFQIPLWADTEIFFRFTMDPNGWGALSETVAVPLVTWLRLAMLFYLVLGTLLSVLSDLWRF